jgi:hypothetical protein
MKNVVPFKPPHAFEHFGIDWSRNARSERERCLREGFLSYESSCGLSGLVSLLLLTIVVRRQGAIADDLQAAGDFAEVMLSMKLAKHQRDALESVEAYLTGNGPLWVP